MYQLIPQTMCQRCLCCEWLEYLRARGAAVPSNVAASAVNHSAAYVSIVLYERMGCAGALSESAIRITCQFTLVGFEKLPAPSEV